MDLLHTVFSTGLLVLEPTVIVREGISIPIQSTFDAQGYQIPQLGPAAAQLYYAINFQGLPYPMGTSADTVVPKIGLPDSPAQANYSVVNRGAKVGINGMFCTIDIATPECNISSAIVAAGPDSNHYVQENATQNFQGIMQDYTCNNGVEYSRLHDMTTNYTEEQVVNASMPHRVLLTMANLPFTPMNHKRDGLLDIGESDSLRFVTYVPAAVAIYLGGTYSSFGSMAATFAPYSILKQRNATPERSITLRLVGKLAPHALLDALKTRHFSVAIILAANFVGGFLTIVISGLYSAIPVNNTRTVMLQQADVIDLSAGNISLEDNQAAAITSLIEYIDLQSPQWTYDDLLFNTMHPITSPSKQDLSHEQPLSAMLQAVRPGLDCFTIPSNDRHIQVYNYTNGLTLMPVSKDWLPYFVIPDKESVIHVGKACLLGWFDDTKIITWGDGATDTSPESGSGMGVEGITLGDSGRPSMAFTLGTVRASRSGRNEKARQFAVESDLATLVCYQRVDYVMANVTFSVPSVTIDTLVPPIRDESTRTVLVDPTTNTTSFAYPINRLLLSIANSLTANMTESDDIAILDGFSRALLSGRGAQPIETLAGEANVENLRKAVTRLYKTYMAQAISANMRRDAELLPAHEGRLTSSARRRLWYNVNNVKVQVTS
ncbi:hypothetical protein VdG2_00106 [Verticillium dahliae VDG2]|nr:hypothetical protein VdG2_00106 [Verticillium dahliae VDG2]